MRLILTTLILSGAVLGGCASMNREPGQRPMSYREELAQLESTCTNRGGILTPIGPSSGSRPANDYACEIRGGASRLID